MPRSTPSVLTLARVKRKVVEILSRRTVTNGRARWEDPEATNGMIDDLQKDVLRAIANGSKLSRSMARAVVDLPWAHYGSAAYPPPKDEN